jgi:hypothetical protein
MIEVFATQGKTMDILEKNIESHVEEMMGEVACPKDFRCYRSGFKNLCKARDIGLSSFVACLMSDPLECKFSLLFGGVFFCTCPIRIYLAKNLGR